jgi:hypothetical protein
VDDSIIGVKSLGLWALFSFHAVQIVFNPLNAELNPICHFLALLGAHLILYVSSVRVKNVIFPL